MTSQSGLQSLDLEAWYFHRLGDFGVETHAFEGLTDTLIRRDRAREATLSNHLELVIVGTHRSKSENFAQAFERIFHEPLKRK